MFGNLRPPSSPPESLERPPSKIFKDDDLSVYEATLAKLKQGSKRDFSPGVVAAETEAMKIELPASHFAPCEEAMVVDADSSSSNCESTGSSKQHKGKKNLSVRYMFSKYKRSSHPAQSTSNVEGMSTDNASCCSESESFGRTKEQSDEECISPFPVCPM